MFVARQPILDCAKHTCAYELLFRDSSNNAYGSCNTETIPTLSVINSSMNDMGWESLTSGQTAFINFPRSLLLTEYPYMLPKDRVILEVLETAGDEEDLYLACQQLKNKGYRLALDDFDGNSLDNRLIDLAHIIKVDLRQTGIEEARRVAAALSGQGLQLLAEKVETEQEYQSAKEMGFEMFQGYFFSKPNMISYKRLSESKAIKIKLLREISAESEIAELSQTIKTDPILTMKLLRYINSAAFGIRHEIQSVRQAASMLGLRELKRWVMVLILADVGSEKPTELLRQVLVRARFCELLATPTHLEDCSDELFLVGLFSLVDALLDQPKEAVLMDLPLSDEVKNTLLTSEETRYTAPLAMAEIMETADWKSLAELVGRKGCDEELINSAYCSAIMWADKFTEGTSEKREKAVCLESE